jgi:predicted acetyltransferase
MDALALVEPGPSHAAEFLAMAGELQAAGTPLAGAEGLSAATVGAYIDRLKAVRAGTDLADGWVPMTTFWFVKDGTQVIGVSRLRHALTPRLQQVGGHIGYTIRPSARRKGYGASLLAHTLVEARALGLERVLLTCDADNLGSRAIIERNGGQLDSEVPSPESGTLVRRYWIEL